MRPLTVGAFDLYAFAGSGLMRLRALSAGWLFRLARTGDVAETLAVVALRNLGMDLHFAFGEAQVSALPFEFAQDVRVDLADPVHNMANTGTQFK
ncbi:unnamed protein product [Macrosiphum euphorbiae]|uniref:Uncharacterized protein n=1 Tax=Macrosiphum euphorbiae TaxID=13131 RepID=A0AAV0XTL9_9HEMI|nr:unnamed protein product [Macrosiphum euphorbiae]